MELSAQVIVKERMVSFYLISGLATFGLLCYLLFVLFKPEYF